jgi:hypothetical protein
MNEQQIRDALRGVAEGGGEADADAAWNEVCRRIAAGRTRRSRRVVLGGAVIASAAAAAAFAILANPADNEAVQVGPAGQPTVTTTEPQPDEDAGADAPVPAQPGDETASGPRVPDHPMAVVVEDDNGQRLDLYDADTGDLLQRDLAHANRITNVSIQGAGLTYTEEVGGTPRVRIMTYDRSRLPFTLTAYVFDNARSGALSEEAFAYVQQGATQGERDRIALLHWPTNTTRYLEWAPGEEDVSLTNARIDDLAFSPDGTRLAFVSRYDGEDDIRVINLTAASLSESHHFADGVADPAWTDLDAMLAVQTCCISDPSADGGLISIVGSVGFERPEDEAVNIAIDGDLLAVVSTDGPRLAARIGAAGNDGATTLEVGGPEADSLRVFAIDGTVVDVGL